MGKKVIAFVCMAIAVGFMLTAVSHAAEEKSTGDRAKNFWQKLFNYPANVTKDSVSTVAETTKRSANVVVEEVKTVGQVTSGNVEKAPDLITEPVKGSADTVAKTVEEIAKIPTEAAKE